MSEILKIVDEREMQKKNKQKEQGGWNVNIKLVFTLFKIKSYFSYKDPIPDHLKSFLVYKFTCASCSSGYIGEICRHFTVVMRNISKRITSLIF